MKTLIIYHANCMDGFGAAWAAYTGIKASNPAADIVLFPATYGDPVPVDLIDKDTKVCILDFSFPVELMLFITELAFRVIVLDHHKTAKEALTQLVDLKVEGLQIDFDMNKSGAMMAWEYFHPLNEPAPLLIQHIQDRDLWKFKMAWSKEFHLNLTTQEKTIENWSAISSYLDEDAKYYNSFIVSGIAIQRYYDQQVQDIISATKRPITINGVAGLCCSCNHMFASDIGNILAKESGTYGACMYQDSKGDVRFSLRSIGDYDVSAIAQMFNGGGHRNAAGFTLSGELEDSNGIKIWRM